VARDVWFETVAIAQERAKRRLPKSSYAALVAASEKGLTVSDNVEAFGELGFAPHVVGALEKRDMSTTIMGQEISLPVIISPTGVQAVDPDGEVAVARAAAARGTAMGLSSFASKPIEDVIAANPKLFFQVYWSGGRRRFDRHDRLVLLAWPGLGQPQDPGADEPADHVADVAGGDHSSRLAVEIRQDAASTGSAGA
jgi:isopentenyl diphosphate isomerase/L-lactate dehydrogenase-like FMN-dependent dehydrogenase